MVNKVILVGNVGNDPKSKHFDDGGKMVTISLATSEKWKDKQGQMQERTEWHRVAFYGRLAEIADDYVRKGMQLYIEGRIVHNEWTDKDGNEKRMDEVRCTEMKMLGRKQDQGGNNNQNNRGNNLDDDIPF